MTRLARRDWWADDPAVEMCGACGCPIQRTPTGAVQDGMRAHWLTVHTGRRPASPQPELKAGG